MSESKSLSVASLNLANQTKILGLFVANLISEVFKDFKKFAV
jgi:hypothetical protein